MISDDEEGEDAFHRLNINTDYIYPQSSSTGHSAQLQEEIYQEENILHQQLAEKDQYLLFAAEAGKALLEKNQELTKHFESLQDEYLRKIEGLQQDRFHLRRELNDQGTKHESCMQDLQQEIYNLGGQLQDIQRSSRAIEHSTESTYQNLSGQNSSLLQELENVKSYNQELTQQVEILSDRIDQQDAVEKVSHEPLLHSERKHNDPITSELNCTDISQIDYGEVQGLKVKVQNLIDQKDFLEESLSGLIKEKYVSSSHQEEAEGTTSRKMSALEGDLSNLRQQVIVCQEDLLLTRKKNENLKEHLEEYVLMQSSHPVSQLNLSLMNELESSMMPEVDMNFHSMSTPLKHANEDTEGTSSHVSNIDFNNKLKADLLSVYHKLSRFKSELTNEPEVHFELEMITTEVIHKIIDEISDFIHKKIVSLGQSGDNNAEKGPAKIDSCENALQSSSQNDVYMCQQLQDLNLHLNMKTLELENVKRELLSTQKTASESSDKVQELTIKMNFQERNVENLNKEREILLNDNKLDGNLKKALQDREEALSRENETKAKFETAQNDMQKLNSQLIAAVQQKHELSEQLEQWQFDMATLIDQQVNVRTSNDNKNLRKRNNNSGASNHKRSFAAKLFTPKSSK